MKIIILIDADDNLISFNIKIGSGDAEEFFYVYNLQGDIVGILDSTGNLVVEYTYDAWGKSCL